MVTKCVSRTRWSKFHKPVSLCSWAVTVAGLPSAVYEETNMVIRIHTYLELDLFSKASPASTEATQKASWNQPGVEPVTGSQWISSSLYSGSGTNRKVSELMVQIKQKSVYGVEPYHQESPWAAWSCPRRPVLLCTRVTAMTHLYTT